MRRVKTYLWSTMSQKQLNSAMVLHIHKDLTNTLDLKSVCKEFISNLTIKSLSVLFCNVTFDGFVKNLF